MPPTTISIDKAREVLSTGPVADILKKEGVTETDLSEYLKDLAGRDSYEATPSWLIYLTHDGNDICFSGLKFELREIIEPCYAGLDRSPNVERFKNCQKLNDEAYQRLDVCTKEAKEKFNRNIEENVLPKVGGSMDENSISLWDLNNFSKIVLRPEHITPVHEALIVGAIRLALQ